MNPRMLELWSGIDRNARAEPLHGDLAELARSPIVEFKGATVLERLLRRGLGVPCIDDLTGFEALANKIHIIDYADNATSGARLVVQGVLYAEALAARLSHLGKPMRIAMNQDASSGAVTVRFFVRRGGVPWGCEDPDAYTDEAVSYWDVG
jgi:hypothetical protein